MNLPPIPFTKMSGAGNDFIIVDNRTGIIPPAAAGEIARRVCTPRQSLGADELMLIEPPTAGGDFSMRTINPDGQEVEMCGNASRCVTRYAYVHGLAGERMTIDTLGGPVYGFVDGDQVRVRVQITAPPELNGTLNLGERPVVVNTITISGTPHAVIHLPDVEHAAAETIRQMGSAIRHHPAFINGINANFADVLDRHTLYQRTFERGVEGETLACGTGSVASSLVSALLGRIESPVCIHVRGGDLSVAFERQGDEFSDIYLGGGARFIAEGVLHPEAWNW